jgi:hypothetical protein
MFEIGEMESLHPFPKGDQEMFLPSLTLCCHPERSLLKKNKTEAKTSEMKGPRTLQKTMKLF